MKWRVGSWAFRAPFLSRVCRKKCLACAGPRICLVTHRTQWQGARPAPLTMASSVPRGLRRVILGFLVSSRPAWAVRSPGLGAPGLVWVAPQT